MPSLLASALFLFVCPFVMGKKLKTCHQRWSRGSRSSHPPLRPPPRPPLHPRLRFLRARHKKIRVTPGPVVDVTLKICSWNVNGLNLRAQWCVQSLIRDRDVDVFCVSETHYRHDVPRERFDIEGFHAWHSDRGGNEKVSSIIIKIITINLNVQKCPYYVVILP